MKCTPCRKGEPPLPQEEVQQRLQSLRGWELIAQGKAICHLYKFKNYAESFAFVTKVSELAEEQGHHPDIEFGWGYAYITFQTHTIDGIHENDLIMAGMVNALQSETGVSPKFSVGMGS